MKLKRHHFFTLLLTAIMMLAALTLLFINQWLNNKIDPEVLVRKVEVVTLSPPPPPPPIQQQQVIDQRINLSLEGDGAPIEVSLNIKAPDIDLPLPPVKMQMNIDFSNALTIDWKGFSLSELDNPPQLLTTRSTSQYPKALVRQGIVKTTVRLDIFVNEHGKVKLIRANGQHHKILKNAILKLIKKSRFTPPIKNGKAVAARFVWPVEFKNS